MRQFTDKVVEFAWDFLIEDLQKVLKCNKQEAILVATKAAKRFGSFNSVDKQPGKVFQMKRPLVAIEERFEKVNKVEHVKGEYSNQNTWDKYKDLDV